MTEPSGSLNPPPNRPTTEFDGARAERHVAAIAYPRRVGTSEERRAAEYIDSELDAAGLQVRREPFLVSQFPVEFGGRLIFVGCMGLMVLGAMFVREWPLLAVLTWGIPVYLINSPWRVARFLGSTWPPRAYSENLVGLLPDAADAPARVVFMAHYDSKSQLMPTGVRVAFVSASTGICAIWSVLALIAALGFPEPISVAGVWLGPIAVSILLVGLIANVTGNRSPGALDNGSGIGALLELARTWRPRPDAPADTVFVATGAEEAGLDGARDFLRVHDGWWREKPTILINLESVGAGPRLYLAGQHQCLRLAHAVAEELGMPHHSLRVLGAGMDHQPFAAVGLNAISILGDVVRRSFAMHSVRDNMSIIERQAMERAGRLASQLAWVWAEIHRVGTAEDLGSVTAPADQEASTPSTPPRR